MKILLTASLLFGGLCANAQETVTEYVFLPHWYGQAQFGMQETLWRGWLRQAPQSECTAAVGYKFNPYIGARLAVNAWQSKGILKMKGQDDPRWKWNYVAPTIDAVVDMTNLIGGYNPNRLVEVNLIAGLGMNIGFGNGEANDINAAISSKCLVPQVQIRFTVLTTSFSAMHGMAQWYVSSDSSVLTLTSTWQRTSRWVLRLWQIPSAITTTQRSAQTPDWYFNALVGVKYAFGPK